MRIALSGDVDIAQRADLAALLSTAAKEARSQGRPLVIDLSGVTFMDSTGISCLIAACAELADPTDLHLVEVPRNVKRVLEITGLDHLCHDGVSGGTET